MTQSPIYLAAALALAFTVQAEATTIPLTPGSGWQIFDVDSLTQTNPFPPLEWIDIGDGSTLAFQFTLAKPQWLEVVDGGFAGDKFQIFDNGVSIGFTSGAVNTYPGSIGLNFDAAWADQNYSRGIFRLDAGTHTITGWLAQSAQDDAGVPIDATVGALRVVPEPASLLLVLTGGSLLAAFKRRHFN